MSSPRWLSWGFLRRAGMNRIVDREEAASRARTQCRMAPRTAAGCSPLADGEDGRAARMPGGRGARARAVRLLRITARRRASRESALLLPRAYYTHPSRCNREANRNSRE
ncbi:hypothetical protein MRX96_007147 [Rhipicephalus microplus]